MKSQSKKKTAIVFSVTILLTAALFALGVVKNNAYNSVEHNALFSGETLFSPKDPQSKGVAVNAVPRSSTWGKIFDFNDEGIADPNYQAYTYDFTVSNGTMDEVDSFSFKLTFGQETFLASGWNGSLEVHQNADGREYVSVIPDLREFDPQAHDLRTVTADGEVFVAMEAGDYFIYTPSSTMNAMEVPIEPYEGTTPGFIVYVKNGEDLSGSTLELSYTFNRPLTNEPLFWISLGGAAIWLVALVIFNVTSAQIKKYKERHERDNKIINESIETFTGFIDAKDPYTNGHSKRVAVYTKLIAKKMGYSEEELDRIYYVALLHDCGKIGVPDSILGKPGRLTPEEFEVIKSHTVRGGEILSRFKSLDHVNEGALYHHERYDGKGYPEGKAGEDIPLIARMICVADSFDAMNTNRVYRNRLSKEQIIGEIESNKGTQFDPRIADILLDLLKDGDLPVGD